MLTQHIVKRPSLQLLVFFIACFGLNLLMPRDFWVQDEMRYAEVVREMLDGGSWLVPHLNGFTYPDKPALYFWLVAWMGAIVGHGEFAFRLVSVLSTLLAGAGVYQLGNQLLQKPHGIIASVIFISLFISMIVGQIMRMDMLLTASAAFAWMHLIQFNRTQQTKSLVYFWLLCLLSLAVKGPIALIFSVLPAFIWMIASSGLQGFVSLRPLSGMLSIIVLVSSWVFAVYQSGQGAYLQTIWH